MACKPQLEWQVRHTQFVVENCTSWFVVEDDENEHCPDCCSMVVDAVAAAVVGTREDFVAK